MSAHASDRGGLALWVTGVGLVTPLGTGVSATWERLVAGDRAIRPIQRFPVTGQRSMVAGEVDGVEVPGPGWSRTSCMAAAAAAEAIQAARLDVRGRRVGLVIGSTTGGMLETEQRLARLHAEPCCHEVPADMLSHPLTSTADRLAERLGPFVRTRTLSSACASGANAMVVAASWLLAGEVDAVVAGGADGLCRLTLTGFNALGALDPEACRPFDRRRRGTSLGEGAGFMVLERAGAARVRGAKPIAELAGWATGAEAHHITNPAPDGVLVASLLVRALARAGLTPEGVDYVNAHGTGTPVNDAAEATALARGLGAEIARIPVSSSKAQLGHSLGAAGAVEAVITALVIQRGTLVPTSPLDEPDPALTLQHVPNEGWRVPEVRAALSCSFGFGGMDTVLAFRTPDERERPSDAPLRSAVITGVAVAGSCGLVSGVACATLPDLRPAPAAFDPDPHLDAARARRLDRSARLGVVVAMRALGDAGGKDPASGVVLGSAFGNVDASAAFMHRVFEKGPRAASPAEFPNLVPSSPVGHASIYLGLHGPAIATADLALSGESAMAQAFELVSCGEAPCVVAGAVEPSSGIVERVLGALFASSPAQAARGLVDVAAAVVIEDAVQAERCQRKVLARITQVLEWRQDAAGAVARLRAPPPGPREVVLGRGSAGADALLEKTEWRACPRVSCAAAMGESDALGSVAVAVAAARIAAGLAAGVLIVGFDDPRGYFIVLSAA